MNTQRAVVWVGFLGLAGALAWAPGHWFGEDSEEALIAGKPVPTQPVSESAGMPVMKPEQATRDLFPRQQWTKPKALATVTEQPVVATSVVAAAPAAPALPFQFVGRLGDRDDLQVFLRSGEKLYVVRQGDVIDDTYRLDRVSANELGLVYLPLHQSQTLSVGSAP
ncbi:Uncharacterised protein [Pseudomonas putida]|uniref:Secretion system X translation initiation factor n=1 Tax=Pseudomonas putida TaxID=303 RepID=A0A379KRK6_PSEPU|nr:hypothetical protein [Pseudomonas putida]SUD69947.1 Uncharacterised protein [Pseudomonas putida]